MRSRLRLITTTHAADRLRELCAAVDGRAALSASQHARSTRLVSADEWLGGQETTLRIGSHELRIAHVGPAHTPEDLMVFHPGTGMTAYNTDLLMEQQGR